MTDAIRKQNERTIWDKNANHYDGNVMRTFAEAYRLTHEAILEKTTSQTNVLEVGCGTGIISLSIAPHVGKVVGMDISPKMIALAEEKAREKGIHNVSFRIADAYELPIRDESFDMVLLTNLLHVVAEPPAVLKEARRVLRQDGNLVTLTDCMAEPVPPKIWLQILGLRVMKTFGKIKYFHFYHKSDLKDLLESNGFILQREAVFHKAPVNYYLTGIKKR